MMKKLLQKIITVTTLMLLPVGVFAQAELPASFTKVLEANKGQVIYLDFWASWCVPCRRSFPWMNAMQEKYGQQNFKVLSINLDAQADLAAKFLAKNPANFDIIYDPKGKIARYFKLKGMPSSYMINAKGKVVSAHVGFTDKKKAQYEQEIVQLISSTNKELKND